MSDLIYVTNEDGEKIIVDIDTAQKMHDDGETVIPSATGEELTLDEVYGEDSGL
jgi:hypothetical protein